MKCRDCGQDGFANIGEVTRHKKDGCPAQAADAKPEQIVIPWDKCDPTLKVLSKGTPMPFIVLGVISDDGVEVRDVQVMRRDRKHRFRG